MLATLLPVATKRGRFGGGGANLPGPCLFGLAVMGNFPFCVSGL